MRFGLILMVALTMTFLACSDGQTPSGDVLTDVTADVRIDAAESDALNDGVVAQDVVADTFVDSGVDVGVDAEPEIWYPPVNPPIPFGPENRGYVEKNGIVHVHSRWSHDGCFPDHEELTSAEIEACAVTYSEEADIKACRDAIIESLMADCVDEYRTAACANGIDFMFQTDHPSDVRYQTFEDALHYRPEAGDEMVKDQQDRPVANRIACPEGSAIDSFYIYYGIEGNKQMPIGMAGPVPDIVYNTSYHIGVPLEEAQAAIAAVHELGGWALACHTEQDDISAERIVELPLDIMEIFNFHPALMDILVNVNILFELDPFMSSLAGAPNPDLSMMLILKPVANDPLRFDEAVKSIRLSHIVATDIHRNVEIPKLCETAETCGDNWIAKYPNLSRLLATGGPAILGDGFRMDSYLRTFRWASNHALVQTEGTDYLNVRDAIGRGRSYSAFDILGVPEGFDFYAVADGAALEMGQEVTGATESKIYFRTPTVRKPDWAGERFGDPSNTEIVTRLIKVDDSGSTVVAEVFGQGWTYEYTVDAPAVYRLEVWMTPTHLEADLGSMSSLSEREYPWIYSNALFFR
ncbi:MAG TPA: hypothetical protein PLY68_09200 [Myxococcota bacterium]|nr:hypothetical protein [Myxococcota bacterium]HOD07976.1 hypothetical protein [Myxococcota bacterium]HPB51616.1 hypothetical protein [Myxococcota bacterium]HQP96353.1 hypothetical protein [Myxococcota bacterium]